MPEKGYSSYFLIKMKACLYNNYPYFRLNLLLTFSIFNLNLSLPDNSSPSGLDHKNVTPEYICPRCGSTHTVKNGYVHNSKPKRLCKTCGRQFVIEPEKGLSLIHI